MGKLTCLSTELLNMHLSIGSRSSGWFWVFFPLKRFCISPKNIIRYARQPVSSSTFTFYPSPWVRHFDWFKTLGKRRSRKMILAMIALITWLCQLICAPNSKIKTKLWLKTLGPYEWKSGPKRPKAFLVSSCGGQTTKTHRG